MDAQVIQNILPLIIPMILAITVHETAHGWVALKCGDTTAYMLGRVSLNPLKHIDPFGTILLPLLTYFLPYILSGGQTTGIFFGYAKPVPVNFGNLKHYRRDGTYVALAGIVANFAMAWLFLIASLLMQRVGFEEPFFVQMVNDGININLMFAALNLFPLLPLDGGRVLSFALPTRAAISYAKIEQYGFFIIIALAMSGLLYRLWVGPVYAILNKLVQLLASPIYFLLN